MEMMSAIQRNQRRDERTSARWREDEEMKKTLAQLQRGHTEPMKPSERVKAICAELGAAVKLSPTATEGDWGKWLACYESRTPPAAARVCVECGAAMRERDGKFGKFWGCTKYPQCRYTENE